MEQFRQQMMEMMGGHAGPSSIAYTYDAQGRVTQISRRIFNKTCTWTVGATSRC
jgi:YD repeat-containing protein